MPKKTPDRKNDKTRAAKIAENKKLFIEMYPIKGCNLSVTCKALGIKSRQSVYTWMDEDEEFALQVKESEEGLKDWAEGRLIKAINDEESYVESYLSKDIAGEFEEKRRMKTRSSRGGITALIFYLKTRCKDRGYIERNEFTGKGGTPLESGKTVIYIPENNRDNIKE